MEKVDPRVAQIPSGPYCYDENGVCPFYHGRHRLANEVEIVWCSYLQQGDTSNLSDSQFEQLKRLHKTNSNEDIWGLYPLDLLWDSVKECGENDEY